MSLEDLEDLIDSFEVLDFRDVMEAEEEFADPTPEDEEEASLERFREESSLTDGSAAPGSGRRPTPTSTASPWQMEMSFGRGVCESRTRTCRWNC